MDPDSNYNEQQDIACRIVALIDSPDDDPNVDTQAELIDCANRLAELVLSLHEWCVIKRGSLPVQLRLSQIR